MDAITQSFIEDSPDSEEDIAPEELMDPLAQPMTAGQPQGGIMAALGRIGASAAAKDSYRINESNELIRRLGEAGSQSANPLSRLSAMISGVQRGIHPAVMQTAFDEADAKAQQRSVQLMMSIDNHIMARQRMAFEEQRMALDQLRFQAKQTQGSQEVYKTFMTLARNLSPDRANAWLSEMMEGEGSYNEADPADGNRFALEALRKVGGIEAKPPKEAAPPKGYIRDDAGNLRIDPGYLAGQTELSRQTARAREREKTQLPSQSLYQVEGPGGEVTYQPREKAVGKKAKTTAKTDILSEILKNAPAEPTEQPQAAEPQGEGLLGRMKRMLFEE